MKKEKLKKYLIVIIPVVLIVIVGIIISKSMNINLLSSNSVIGNYYYCEDQSYQLVGSKCKKKVYTSPYLVGDVTHDNKIDISDVSYIQLYLAGKKKV